MKTTYRVYFIGRWDGLPNEKLLETNNIEDIYEYMAYLGHTITYIEEV